MSLVLRQDYKMIPSGIIINEFVINELEYPLQNSSLGSLHQKTSAMIPVHLLSF